LSIPGQIKENYLKKKNLRFGFQRQAHLYTYLGCWQEALLLKKRFNNFHPRDEQLSG